MKRDKHLDELEARRNKTLPPGSRHHQYWCAIFKAVGVTATTTRRPRRDGDGGRRPGAPSRQRGR